MKKEFIVLAVIIVVLGGILLLHKRNSVNYTIPSLDAIKDHPVTPHHTGRGVHTFSDTVFVGDTQTIGLE